MMLLIRNSVLPALCAFKNIQCATICRQECKIFIVYLRVYDVLFSFIPRDASSLRTATHFGKATLYRTNFNKHL